MNVPGEGAAWGRAATAGHRSCPCGGILQQKCREHALSVPNQYGLSWVVLPNALCSKNVLVKRNSPALGAEGCLVFGSQMRILSQIIC